MSISRKWWEPEPQDHRHDREDRGRRLFDLDDLQSLAIGGGEFANFAELLCGAGVSSAALGTPRLPGKCACTRSDGAYARPRGPRS